MSDFEDEDHTRFFKVEDPDGEGVVISAAAFQLSAAALANSVHDGTPGFISDEYLGAIAAETDLTATELVMAGEWERVEGGYRVLDPRMLEMAEKMMLRNMAFDDWPLSPEDCQSHRAGPNSGGRCVRCGTPLDDDEEE